MNTFIISLHISHLHWVNALVVSGIFVFIALIVNLFIVKVLNRLVKFTKSNIDDIILDILHRPIYMTIILMGIINGLFWLVTDSKVIRISMSSIYTLITFIWMLTFFRLSHYIINNAIIRRSDGQRKDIVPLFANITKIVIIILALMVILSIWRIDITPLWASAGIASVIIALAAKESLANFFGGVSIFLDKPYQIGDYIELDQKERGEVVEIGVRSTKIKTRDDILITIPNSIIANTKIINESAPIPHFRVRVPIIVAYGTDMNKLESILVEIARKNDNILPDPEPRLRIRKLGENGIESELLSWAKEPSIRGLTIHEVLKEILIRFNDEGIIIPYPHRELIINNVRQDF
jgi:MscS family membrane protein